jgi:hypothetical protein
MVARSSGPYYNLPEMIGDCAVSGRVIIRKDALKDARQFGLDTQARVLDFLSAGVLEDLTHDNTECLDSGGDAGTLFDAYIFKSGPKFVYFAFYRRHNGVWVIKSFHSPDFGEKAPSLSHTPFACLEVLKK